MLAAQMAAVHMATKTAYKKGQFAEIILCDKGSGPAPQCPRGSAFPGCGSLSHKGRPRAAGLTAPQESRRLVAAIPLRAMRCVIRSCDAPRSGKPSKSLRPKSLTACQRPDRAAHLGAGIQALS